MPYKPIITVAPSSKLMSQSPQTHITSLQTLPAISAIRKAHKSARKRRSIRLCSSISTNMQSRKPVINTRSNVSLLNINNHGDHASLKPATLTSLQDSSSGGSSSKTVNNNTIPLVNGGITTNLNKRDHTNHYLPPPPNLYPLRHPIIQNHSRFMQQPISPTSIQLQPAHISPQQQQQQQPKSQLHTKPATYNYPTNVLPQHTTILPPTQNTTSTPFNPPPPPSSSVHDQGSPYLFGSPAPPVTVLVPYPIILPIPIPIPIPMPILEFLKAVQAKLDKEKNSTNNGASSSTNTNSNHLRPTTITQSSELTASASSSNDEPLDCTKSKTITTNLPVLACASESLQSLAIAEKENSLKEITEEQLANDIIQEEICIDSESASEPISSEPASITALSSKEIKIIETNKEQPPPQQRLPKLKITRFNSKRIVAKEIPIQLESSRPLRKRKRVIDCDYLRIKDDDKKKI